MKPYFVHMLLLLALIFTASVQSSELQNSAAIAPTNRLAIAFQDSNGQPIFNVKVQCVHSYWYVFGELDALEPAELSPIKYVDIDQCGPVYESGYNPIYLIIRAPGYQTAVSNEINPFLLRYSLKNFEFPSRQTISLSARVNHFRLKKQASRTIRLVQRSQAPLQTKLGVWIDLPSVGHCANTPPNLPLFEGSTDANGRFSVPQVDAKITIELADYGWVWDVNATAMTRVSIDRMNLGLLDGLAPEPAGKSLNVRHYNTEAERKLRVHLDGQPLPNAVLIGFGRIASGGGTCGARDGALGVSDAQGEFHLQNFQAESFDILVLCHQGKSYWASHDSDPRAMKVAILPLPQLLNLHSASRFDEMDWKCKANEEAQP